MALSANARKDDGERQVLAVKRPKYLRDFSCAGSKCIDTCCKDWHIDLSVHEFAYLRYEIEDPELKEILASAIKEDPARKKGSETGFGYIELDAAGKCPVLDSCGLCRLQVRAGEEALSKTCRTYPRSQILVTGPNPEFLQHASMSCPEVARLVMSDPAALDVKQVTVDTEAVRLPATVMVDGQRSTLAARYFSEIRTSVRQLLEAHAADPSLGLFAVAMFGQALSRREGRSSAQDAAWIAERVSVYASREFASGFSGLRSDPSIAFSILQAFVRLRFRNPDRVVRTYVEHLNESFRGLGFDPEDEAASLAGYVRARDEFPARMRQRPWMMRNIALAMFESSAFPAFDGPELWSQLVGLCIRYTLLRMVLIGTAARQGGPLDSETAVRAVYAYSRVMDHNAGFLEAARKMLEEKGLATPAGMAVLIRG
jgi:lysine-N-methylase